MMKQPKSEFNCEALNCIKKAEHKLEFGNVLKNYLYLCNRHYQAYKKIHKIDLK